MASLIAIPFLIGSVPLGLAVVGANHFLKDKRKTNKFLYWGGITASAFGGWVVSNMLMTRYVESEVLGAENSDSKFKQPYYGKDGLDFGRDNKGRFRRKLVTPITNTEYEKGMLTKRIIPTPSNPSPPLSIHPIFDDGAFTEIEDITPPFKPPQYFYRWIGGASGNPIFYGYPEVDGKNFLVHYVHPIYDEAYVKSLVYILNDIHAYND